MIGQKIKHHRTIKGLSQSDLALIVGVKQEHISRWERGLHAPLLCNLHKIAEALNVNISELC